MKKFIFSSALFITLATAAEAGLTREDAMYRVGELSAVTGFCSEGSPGEIWAQSDLLFQYVNVADSENDLWQIYYDGAQRGANLVVELGCIGAIDDLKGRLDNYHF